MERIRSLGQIYTGGFSISENSSSGINNDTDRNFIGLRHASVQRNGKKIGRFPPKSLEFSLGGVRNLFYDLWQLDV